MDRASQAVPPVHHGAVIGVEELVVVVMEGHGGLPKLALDPIG